MKMVLGAKINIKTELDSDDIREMMFNKYYNVYDDFLGVSNNKMPLFVMLTDKVMVSTIVDEDRDYSIKSLLVEGKKEYKEVAEHPVYRRAAEKIAGPDLYFAFPSEMSQRKNNFIQYQAESMALPQTIEDVEQRIDRIIKAQNTLDKLIDTKADELLKKIDY